MMPARRILLLIPHPDDETVGCAAAIARARAAGAEIFGLYLTTGVAAAGPRAYSARVLRRRREALRAAAALGLEPLHFAERPSRTLKAALGEALCEIAAALARSGADAVWAPAWEGGHQDHDVANFLAAQIARRVPVTEYAEYNYAGGWVRSQLFPHETGGERVLRLSADEAAMKRRVLALYRSERGNLRHVLSAVESLRPLPRHDYARPPHAGRLFRERFHWVPFRHPRVDFERTGAVLAALRDFAATAPAL